MTEREWWMPYRAGDDPQQREDYEGPDDLTWLCDHVGEAEEVMVRLWQELCKHRPDLPFEGFEKEP